MLLIQQPVDGAPASLEERGADRRLPHMECMCSVHGSCAPSARVQETGRLKAYAVYMQCVCSAYAGCLQRMQPLGRAQPAVHLVVKGVDGSAVRTAVELQHGTPQPLGLAAARPHREHAVSTTTEDAAQAQTVQHGAPAGVVPARIGRRRASIYDRDEHSKAHEPAR